MKKFCITFFLFVIIILTAMFGTQPTQTEYLRVHIRANSNGAADQSVKYEVKDAVVAYLSPLVEGCERKREAIELIRGLLSDIEDIAEDTLRAFGYSYGARASLRREEFPTRVYEDVTLEAGVYDALILELGSGEGDNWWCVVYPPLCFTADKVVYRSFIWEILRHYIGG